MACRCPSSCRWRSHRSGALLESVNAQIKRADDELAHLVKDDPVVKRLTTVPGVDPVTAACFVSTLDDVNRFPDAKQARAYLGLVPSEYSSGERAASWAHR